MKRKRDFPHVSLKTLILWATVEKHLPTKDRVEFEIAERQKELQQ